MKSTAEDTDDGAMLRNAIRVYIANRTAENFLDVLVLLRNSYVWIPCNMIMSDADYASIEQAVNQALENDDPNSLIGQQFTNRDIIRMVPDILTRDGKFYFPVFTGEGQMGEYGTHFSKLEKHFLDALALAVNNEKDVTGIVIDAFTVPFILDRELFDVVRNLKSGPA